MKPILVLYATREGQTRKIAERVVERLSACGLAAELRDASDVDEAFTLEPYAGAILAASVHAGTHEREIAAFVVRHRSFLAGMPAAFLSVSLSEAGAEDPGASAERRARAAEEVAQMLERFFEKTAWRPRLVLPIAGALPYSKYGVLKRWVMKRIVKSMGGPTDTSRDYEFTNFGAVDDCVDRFVASLEARDRSIPGTTPGEPEPRRGEPAEPREGPRGAAVHAASAARIR
jgi:menaquinone-dependent protoporphyrinogen oxidase